MAGADTIDSVLGPLSTSLSGIKLLMKAALDVKPWLTEPAIVPIPWDSKQVVVDDRPLKVAVMWHDGVVKPHPPITRALESVVDKLKSLSNITIVDWQPHLHDEAWAIISNLYYPDGGAEDAEAIDSSGEPWRPLTSWVIKENPCVKKLTQGELNYWLEEREIYRKEYANIWTATSTGRNPVSGDVEGMVDIILCPVGPGVAPEHGTAKYWCYTSQWNLLNYPAVVFPVSKVDASVDVPDKKYKPKKGVDKDNWDLCRLHCFTINHLLTLQTTRKSSTDSRFHYNWWEGDLRMRRSSQSWSIWKRRSAFLSCNSPNLEITCSVCGGPRD